MRLPTIKPFREMNPVPIGIAFLVVMAALLVLSFNLDKLPFTSGTGYSAALAKAEGLRKGDRVMVGGVVVGKVGGVSLEGTHVRVDFTITDDHARLGRDSTASVQIATLLGNKYLALDPKGPGSWPPSRELPLTQTATTYDVEPALQGLGRTVGHIDTDRLAAALDSLAAAFRDAPTSVRSMLRGLSRVSETVASRDQQLSDLLRHADTLTGVLAARRGDIARVFGSGDQLLQMLDARHAVIDALLRNTSRLSVQLHGLVQDNQASLRPALQHVRGVLDQLNGHQSDLDQVIKELYVFVRGEVDATGSGPWFDGSAINALNPIQVGATPRLSPAAPRTLGDLLGVGAAEDALTRRAAR